MAKVKKAVASEKTAKKSLANVIAEIKDNFAERDGVIDVLFGLFLAGQNALLLGPPGTGKSALVEAVSVAFGGEYFRYLLTRFTTDAEVFGPFSISALKNDSYRRASKGFMPEATTVFLDEIFKANSSILNSLLTILNEKEYFDDGQRKKVPLRMCIGASNELPEGPELAALYDRFIARFWIPEVSMSARYDVMAGKYSAEPPAGHITEAETKTLIKHASRIPFPADMLEKFQKVDIELGKIGIQMTDRRRRSLYKTLPYIAYVQGDTEVTEDTLVDFLPDLIWQEPGQRASIASIVAKIANPRRAKAQEIVDAATQMIADEPALANITIDDDSETGIDPQTVAKITKIKQEIRKMAQTIHKLDPNFKFKTQRDGLGEIYSKVQNFTLRSLDLGEFDAKKMSRDVVYCDLVGI